MQTMHTEPHWSLHAQMTGSLQNCLACSMFPAPRALPTSTLAAVENPNGNWGENKKNESFVTNLS